MIEKKCYYKCRKAGMHGRTTVGRIYAGHWKDAPTHSGVKPQFFMTADDGKEFWACVEHVDYWQKATSKAYSAQFTLHTPKGKERDKVFEYLNSPEVMARITENILNNNALLRKMGEKIATEKFTMSKIEPNGQVIEKVLMIDGIRADNYTEDDLMGQIKVARKDRAALLEVSDKSKYIQARVADLEKREAKLIEILDSRAPSAKADGE